MYKSLHPGKNVRSAPILALEEMDIKEQTTIPTLNDYKTNYDYYYYKVCNSLPASLTDLVYIF